MAAENAALCHEVSEMQRETLRLLHEKAALKGQPERKRRQAQMDSDVRAVLRFWQRQLSPRSSIDLEGKRADVVRKALRSLTHGTRSERRHTCIEAIAGVALRPYDAGYGKRTADPAKGKKRVSVEHIFASEERIEAYAELYRDTLRRPREWNLMAWQAASQVQDRYFRLLLRTPPEAETPGRAQLHLVVDNTQEAA